MRFANPPILVLALVLLPLLAGFLYWSWRKRRVDVSRFVRSRLLAHLTVGVSATNKKTRMLLLLLAVVCLILALARPQWGYTLEELKQHGLDIIVAIDTSRSMLAEDIAPNRLTRAKLAALELMPLAKTDRLGLVAFAGTAFLQCPLTLDDEAFRQSVNIVDVGIIPQGGTDIAQAIRTAMETLKDDEENEKVLVIITDGEDHEGNALEAARDAAKANVRIFTIGVGTPQGELLRQQDKSGAISFFKDADGNAVRSRLDEESLRQIAAAAKGFYLPLVGANTIDLLYRNGLAPLLGQLKLPGLNRPERHEPRFVRHFKDRFQWPLGLAIVLLVLEIFFPERKPARRPEKPIAHTTNAGLEKIAALFLVVAFASTAEASSAKAMQWYKSGNYQDAQREYQRLAKQHPNDPRYSFNAGASAYQAKKFDAAADQFTQALTAPDLALQQRAYYNLGNSRFRLGEQTSDPKQTMAAWEEAVKAYDGALKLNPHDDDARFNRDLVKKRLEEIKKQQEQQKSQPNSQKQDQDQKKKNEDNNKNQKQSQDNNKKQSQDQSSKTNSPPQSPPKPQPDQDQDKKDSKPRDQNQSSRNSRTPDKKQEQKEEQKGAQAQKPDQGQNQTNNAAAAAVPEGQMTPQQALQLLDAQKHDEKAFRFIPPDITNRVNSPFKDW
ncbi:MAG: VWA domain-containing protein [Candidatus Omnitrophica bacterium]|nr:VWA domain-containing protein [Candidatus Omnitrophota bacterium]